MIIELIRISQLGACIPSEIHFQKFYNVIFKFLPHQVVSVRKLHDAMNEIRMFNINPDVIQFDFFFLISDVSHKPRESLTDGKYLEN